MTSPSTPTRPIVVNVFGRTDVGRTREHNEDAFVVCDLTADRSELVAELRTHAVGELGSLFMVADGMGGAAAGELASEMATDVVLKELREHWRTAAGHDGEAFAAAIRAAAEEANARIHAYATKHPENRGMGSTSTIAGLLGDTLYLAQVGDSRGYLVRDGKARQITRDQSLVQRLVEAGEITAEEAEQSDRRNIILQALGPEPTVKVDLTHQQVKRGDVLVLCSDGLSGQVRTDEIGQVVGEEHDLVNICQRLIDMANEAGGPDNITVIAVRFDGDGLDAATSDDEVRHRVFQAGTEDRVTMQVLAITDEIVAPLTPDTAGENAATGALAPPGVSAAPEPEPSAPAAAPSMAPAAASEPELLPTPRGPSRGTLRLTFLGIAVLAAAIWLLFIRG
jgi:serine/threonine protein phosphatase PrpC